MTQRNWIERMIARGERVADLAEQGDEAALWVCGFITLTAISALALLAVLILRWWI